MARENRQLEDGRKRDGKLRHECGKFLNAKRLNWLFDCSRYIRRQNNPHNKIHKNYTGFKKKKKKKFVRQSSSSAIQHNKIQHIGKPCRCFDTIPSINSRRNFRIRVHSCGPSVVFQNANDRATARRSREGRVLDRSEDTESFVDSARTWHGSTRESGCVPQLNGRRKTTNLYFGYRIVVLDALRVRVWGKLEQRFAGKTAKVPKKMWNERKKKTSHTPHSH